MFFSNIDLIDKILNPNRRGFSKKLRDELGVARNTVSYWRNSGVVPHDTSLKVFTRVISKLLEKKFGLPIKLTLNKIKNENIQEFLDEYISRSKLARKSESTRERKKSAIINNILSSSTGKHTLIPVIDRILPDNNYNPTKNLIDQSQILEYIYFESSDSESYSLVIDKEYLDGFITKGDYIILSPNSQIEDDYTCLYKLKDGDSGIIKVKKIKGGFVSINPKTNLKEILILKNSDILYIHRIFSVIKKV